MEACVSEFFVSMFLFGILIAIIVIGFGNGFHKTNMIIVTTDFKKGYTIMKKLVLAVVAMMVMVSVSSAFASSRTPKVYDQSVEPVDTSYVDTIEANK